MGVLLGVLLLGTGSARAAIFVVDSTGDGGDSAPGNGTCRAAGNVCTLRAALEEANALAGADVIQFGIGTGPVTIAPASTLPTITSQVTIDGTSQPGFVSDPIVQLNISSAGPHGLTLGAGSSNSVIRGLVINRAPNVAIRVFTSNNVVAGNFLGTNSAGTAASANAVGVYIQTGTNNTIGGLVAADRNVISGNSLDGVQIDGASGNFVRGNYIGLDKNGANKVANLHQGVALFGGASNNTVGGAGGARNIISGNDNDGVLIAGSATGNHVDGNFIGTDAAGNDASVGNLRGIEFDVAAFGNFVGNTVPNRIAYNINGGVETTGAAGTGNLIRTNEIHSNGTLGIDLGENGVTNNDVGDGDTGPNNYQNYPLLTAAMTDGSGMATFAGSLNSAASTLYRVEFFASTAPDGTGFGEGERYLGFTNVMTDGSGNATIKVTLATTLTAGEYVTATATDPSNNTSEFSAAKLAVGFLLVTTTALTMDGTTTSVANLIAAPGADGLISLPEAITATNATGGADTIGFGIPITDANHRYYRNDAIASSLTNEQPTTLEDASIGDFDPDYVGTPFSWFRIRPSAALPVVSDSVVLDAYTQPGAQANTVAAPGTSNAILKIVLDGSLLAGGNDGLTLTAGSSAVRGFVIQQFPDIGIFLTTNGGNVIDGNYLGTDPTGTLPLGNGYGVRIEGGSSGNTIGGTTPGARNLLSGSQTQDGVYMTGAGTNNNVVQGNFIGTDVRGTAALANADRGVQIESGASLNVIGGTTAAERNIISGNGSDGVIIADALLAGTTGNVVEGNYIGTDVTGALPLGNAQHGVHLGPVANNRIGGSAAGAGNIIAHSALRGIRTAPNTLSGNSVLGNSIHSNGGLGFDLGADGVTANDALDGDSGPNDLLNWPFLTGVIESGGNLTVYYKLDVPAGSYRVEFFKNPSGADGSGNGEGEVFASATSLTHPGGGSVDLNHSFPGAVGDVITATTTFCTDGATCSTFGSTSEFSNAFTAVTTAVTLTSFTALGRDGAVDLVWKTGSELNNLGFHLYRSRSAAGPFERITSVPIPGLGSSPTGAAYAHSDESLSNGVTYYYELEDIETTGRTTLHGPIAATPREDTADASDDDEPKGESRTTYGEPCDVSLRILERGPNGVIVELTTGGFIATPLEDGTVRLEVPGFESIGAEGSPSLPVRRTWLEAVAGRSVRVLSVRELETTSWPGLRPADALATEVIAIDGTVRAGTRRARRSSRDIALFPATAARVVETGFQGDVKKALVELAPLRWDARTGRLLWTRRLLVHLSFSGQDASERGERARRRRDVGSHRDERVLARLATTGPGLYRVEFEEIFPRGGRSLSSGSLRLSRLGASVAYHLEPSSDRFGPGSSLYFLSEGGAANPYGPEAVYELELGAAGTVMAVRSETASGPPLSEALERKEWEQNHYYQAGLLKAPSPWLWDVVLSRESKSYPFEIDGLEPRSGDDAKLEVYLQGGSDFDADPDHHLRLFVNGVFVGEERSDGKIARTMTLSLLPGILHEGENELSVENLGDTGAAYSMVFLDRFALTYPRRPVADSGWFRGTFRDAGNAVVEGLGKGSVVLETSSEPVWLEGARTTSAGMSFHVEGGESYLAVSPEAVLEAKVRKPTSSDLRSPRQQADYLLVAPRDFLAAAAPLVKRRREQGLAAKAVAIEDVYDEFGYGEARPEALKEFLAYAYHEWRAPSPRYVVLLGDATYDGKNFLGTGVTNRVPTLMKKTSYLWTASDPSYAAVNGEDGLPDLALGRLPAASPDEARVLVAKLLAYEDSGRDLSGPAVFVADDPDAAGDFESDSDEIAGLLSNREITKIYLGDLGPAETRYRVVSAFDNGASFLSYVGHGGIGLWANENVFGNPDVPTLGPQKQQPIVLTMNCLNGYFHFPYFDSLAEALVKAEGKGAIAAFAPSGLSLDAPAHLYHRFLMEELTSGRNARLGDAVLRAQIRYAESGAFPELLTIYHLFGDPALPLR